MAVATVEADIAYVMLVAEWHWLCDRIPGPNPIRRQRPPDNSGPDQDQERSDGTEPERKSKAGTEKLRHVPCSL